MSEPERVATWREVMPGDRVRGADGKTWQVENVIIAKYSRMVYVELRRFDDAGTVSGTPLSDGVVTILYRGSLGRAVDALAAAGLESEAISQ